jgi:UDP-N-acetylglucosamine acyltransferase
LKRRGFSRDTIHKLRAAYRKIFLGSGALMDRVEEVSQEFSDEAAVQKMVAFIKSAGKRRITTARGRGEEY